MSDISTTLSMNGPIFTQGEILSCSIFNLKMFLFVLMILICISCLSSCLNSMFSSGEEMEIQSECNLEQFSNDNFFSYKDAIYPNYSHYQSASLTSKTNNLVFGQANRYVYPDMKDKQPMYILEIFANLYVLNGNPFGVTKLTLDGTPFKHKYIAILKETKTGKRKEIGQVKRDGDGLYKLKFNSKEPNEFIIYNELEIVHRTDEKDTPVLNGRFTIL